MIDFKLNLYSLFRFFNWTEEEVEEEDEWKEEIEEDEEEEWEDAIDIKIVYFCYEYVKKYQYKAGGRWVSAYLHFSSGTNNLFFFGSQ